MMKLFTYLAHGFGRCRGTVFGMLTILFLMLAEGCLYIGNLGGKVK